MKRKILALASVLCLSGVLASCGGATTSETTTSVKVGLITLHDENSTYDKNFIDAFKAAAEAKGVTTVIKTGIPEGNECYEEAADMADSGCAFVFADSFGHEDYMIKAAKEFPNVQFSHGTGTKAHTENLSNYHNAFASIYEGRYLAGVAAGLKLKSMIEADASTSHVLGYVGAYTYAEVISGYTAYYLGAKSIVDDVTMKVQFTGSWYDEAAEKSAAEALIAAGCSILSQHADSWGAPTACETAGVPNITYNGSTESNCPNTYVISSRINWQPYFEACFDAILNNGTIETDYTGSLGADLYSGSVVNTTPGAKAAASGTEDYLKTIHTKLVNKEIRVFDTSTFTVNGETLTSYLADVNSDADYTKDTEAIKLDSTTGISYFAESEYRSAPYFDVQIDGITLLNSKY
jgi:basic membrane protein A